MAIKTFISGEVLTASDTNTYLNNGGLVWIAGGSATNTSALDVNNVFSSTYDNYRIVVEMASRTTLQYGLYQLRTAGALTTTNYNSAAKWFNLTLANTLFQDNDARTTSITGGPSGDQSLNRWAIWSFDLSNPNKAQQTGSVGAGTGVRKDDNWYSYINGGVQSDSTQFTGIRFIPSVGTYDIRYKIYGYRQS
jgi:hypothetical protein